MPNSALVQNKETIIGCYAAPPWTWAGKKSSNGVAQRICADPLLSFVGDKKSILLYTFHLYLSKINSRWVVVWLACTVPMLWTSLGRSSDAWKKPSRSYMKRTKPKYLAYVKINQSGTKQSGTKKRISPSFISKYRLSKKIADILTISVIHSSLFCSTMHNERVEVHCKTWLSM